MKPLPTLLRLLAALSCVWVEAQNVAFQSGSDGRDGALHPTSSVEIPLPDDGILRYSTVRIPPLVTVTFTRNPANTPVYLLVQGDVEIHGTISVNGEVGTGLRGGRGGPGGFDGGLPGIAGSLPGDGLGPGAGRGSPLNTSVGRGVFGNVFSQADRRLTDGEDYGTPLLTPLFGGSGGGGLPGFGGGGGGGALLIASNTRITNSPGSSITALGAFGFGSSPNWGSGGAIRLVAPEISGEGLISVTGPGGNANAGRIRCDLIERRFFGLRFNPVNAVSASEAFMVAMPANLPTLRLVRVAGVDVPLAAPAGFTVTLPFNAPAVQEIVLEAAGFSAEVLVDLRLTPGGGAALPLITGSIPNFAPTPARLTLQAGFPPNTPVTVEAWTR
jgi:hypothetical protein